MAAASLANWLCMGKKWSEVPSHVEHAGKAAFRIPSKMEAHVLPSQTVSVRSMLEFTLPSSQAPNNSPDISTFFKKESPHGMTQSTLMRLRRLSLPSPSVVGKLVDIGYQAWLDGYQSIQYTHLI